MASSKVKARVLRNARVTLAMSKAIKEAGKWTFDHYQRTDPWRHDMISFTSVLYHPGNGLVYCGLTSMDNDVLYTFNPETEEFKSLNYAAVGERFDCKIHRSFELDDDGTIYAATAGLHDYAEHPEAPGGKIMRIDPKTHRIEIVGIPVPHDYVQTIALDKKRKVIYGNCYPLGSYFGYKLKTKEVFDYKAGPAAHKMRCDNEGNLWGISKVKAERQGVNEEQREIMEFYFKMEGTTPHLFKYNPEEGLVILPCTMPSFSGQAQTIGNSIDGGDGYMYIGTSVGALYRLDKRSYELDYLGLPNVGGRLEGLAIGKDGLIYGAGGSFYQTRLFAYDREADCFHDLGPVYDPDIDEICIIVHDLCMTGDGTIYVGETDNMERSGYLWECHVTW